jgi:hypothetical protein
MDGELGRMQEVVHVNIDVVALALQGALAVRRRGWENAARTFLTGFANHIYQRVIWTSGAGCSIPQWL